MGMSAMRRDGTVPYLLMRRRFSHLGLVLTVFVFYAALAETVRVPQDCPSIQGALDRINNFDTVLVAVGIYAEALHAPPLHFVLKGDVEIDSIEYPRPVIDPSSLPGSDSLGCLYLPEASQPILEDLMFRNGPQMFPHREDRAGGIRSFGHGIVMRRCILDSTYRAYWHWRPFGEDVIDSLTDCMFRNLQYVGVYFLDYALVADHCSFLSGNAFSLCSGGPGSQFLFCRFGYNPMGESLVMDGDNCEVSNCIFEPQDITTPTLLFVSQTAISTVIRDNLFTGRVLSAALSIRASGQNAFVVRDNLFTGVSGGTALWMRPDMVYQAGHGGLARHNVFLNCFSADSLANDLMSGQDNIIEANRLAETQPDPHTPPAIAILEGGETRLRDNLFLHTGYALRSDGTPVDAQLNYWGSPDGPYHAQNNPFGHGDTITGNDVLFMFWYPDTSFLLSIPGLGKPLPQTFVLEAYPNPFNSTVHLTLIPSHAQIVKLELFNVLGRKVSEIWKGPLAFQKELSFDANGLSSGLYFARVTDVIERRPLATRKLMLLK